jgi:hypothetical protein
MHVPEIGERVLVRLLAHDETAAYFRRSADEHDEAGGEVRRQALRDWVDTVLTCDADPAVAESVAVLARAYTRRGGGVSTQLKGRYFVATAALLLEEVARLLASGRKPAVESRKIAAWGKLVALHLDILLAVLDSAERGRQWY